MLFNNFHDLVFFLNSHSQMLSTSGISQGAKDKCILSEVAHPKLVV